MIVVCSLADFENVCESIKPSHAISVIDPGFEPNTPKNVKHHLKIGFDDIVSINDSGPIYRLPGQENGNIQTLFTKENSIAVYNFLKNWDSNSNIVIHCWCGISRSMATAAFLLCSLDKSNIDRNVRYIRSVAPHAKPNKLMLSFYEEILKTKGEISNSFDKYPTTKAYDCEINFAPITLFDIVDMKNFQ